MLIVKNRLLSSGVGTTTHVVPLHLFSPMSVSAQTVLPSLKTESENRRAFVFDHVAQLSVDRPTSVPDIQITPSFVIAIESPSRAAHRVQLMPRSVERNAPEVLETAYQSSFGATFT